jgi:hypothetical protein
MVVNRVDSGVGLCLRLSSFVRNELAGYIINDDRSEDCRICFAAREYVAGENNRCLDGAIVKIAEVFTATTQTARCTICSTTTVVTHMRPSCPLQPELELKVIDYLSSHQFKTSTFNT